MSNTPVSGAAQAKPLDSYTAVMIAEGVEDSTQEEFVEAFQHLIDTGLAWQLQGYFGRTARDLIEAGHCHQKGKANV